MSKHTIYCAGDAHPAGYIVSALADDGHCLAQHACSHKAYARHDIGIDSERKHEYYDKHFGAGNWQLEWVDDAKTHPGWLAALELNRAIEQKSQ